MSSKSEALSPAQVKLVHALVKQSLGTDSDPRRALSFADRQAFTKEIERLREVIDQHEIEAEARHSKKSRELEAMMQSMQKHHALQIEKLQRQHEQLCRDVARFIAPIDAFLALLGTVKGQLTP